MVSHLEAHTWFYKLANDLNQGIPAQPRYFANALGALPLISLTDVPDINENSLPTLKFCIIHINTYADFAAHRRV